MRLPKTALLGAASLLAILFNANAANAQASIPAEASPATDATVPPESDVNGKVTKGQNKEDDGAIVVTGSRIAHTRVDTISPVSVITSKDLDTRGFSTLADALNEQPQFGIPGSSPVGDAQSGFGPGQNFINFLGLGSQRTLVLVNGQRFVSSNTASIFGPTGSGGGQVDLNIIPTKLIDHVETVAAIGAPIYGSDAIAGTVNVILKKNYQGFDIDGQAGISKYSDAQKYRVRALAGLNFADGRGNITIAGEYDTEKGLRFTDRGLTTSDDRFDSPRTPGQFTLVPYSDFRVPSVDVNGIPLVGGSFPEFGFHVDFPLSPQQQPLVFGPGLNFGVGPDGTQLKFDAAGNLIPIDFGQTIGPDDGFNVFTSGGNGLSLPQVENLLTDLKRYSANLITRYEFSDRVRVFGEGWYSVSQGRNLTSQPAYNSGLFDYAGTRDGNVILSIDNAFLTPSARAEIVSSINNNPLSDLNLGRTDNQDYFYLGRANYDLENGVATGKTEVYRFVGGVEADLRVLPVGDWKAQVTANYGHSLTSSVIPSLNQQNFLNAVNAVRDANGNIVCAPGYVNSGAATISSVCAPLNLFGQQTSQAARDYVTSIARPKSVNTQKDFVSSIAGPLFKLPGGNLSFAAGYEHREESSRFDPGTFYFGVPGPSPRETYGRSVPIDPVFGKFKTNEFFGELDGDLIGPENAVPLISSLSFQTAGRYVKNSIAGNDFTWTAGARYAPVRDLSFRVAFTRAIRSPSVTEAFNPSSSSFIFANDPCNSTNVNSGPAPATRAANCAAAGIVQPFSALSNQRSFNGITVGNAALQNEIANSFTAGTVFRPRFVSGLTMTVDYVNIRLKQAISAFSPDQVLNACYDSTSFATNPFCALITRDSANQLSLVKTSYFNSALLQYRGVLVGLDYRLPTPFLGATSRLDLSASAQHLLTLNTSASAGDAPSKSAGSIGSSKNRGVASATYTNGGFTTQLQGNYIGPANLVPDQFKNQYSIPRVKGVVFTNFAISRTFGKRFTLRGDIDNLFDVKPPYPALLLGAYSTYFPGILGRYYRVGVEAHF